MEHILTIDLEEWYHANFADDLLPDDSDPEVRVVENTGKLLELFDRYGAKATFFTLGVIADKHPELIRQINAKGHEIATHGYGHQLVYNQTEQEFEDDLQQAIAAIERAIGRGPTGYRAPSWSVKPETPWVYPVLKRNGIRYDASVFPVKTFLYGIPEAPRLPFWLEFPGGELPELPTSTFPLWHRKIPFSGGFYFRFLPYMIVRRLFRSLQRRGEPVIFYLHPREVDPRQPRLNKLNRRDAFIHYCGIGRCAQKLEKLLQEFHFITAETYLRQASQKFTDRWSLTQAGLPAAAGRRNRQTIGG